MGGMGTESQAWCRGEIWGFEEGGFFRGNDTTGWGHLDFCWDFLLDAKFENRVYEIGRA